MSLFKSVKSLPVLCASAALFVCVGVYAVPGSYTDGPCQYNDGTLPPTTDCHYDPTTNSESCMIIDYCPDGKAE